MSGEQLQLVYNGKPPSVKGSETSGIAADLINKSAGGLRREVLNYVRSCPDGATCDEIELHLCMRHQTASARCRELVLMGQLEKRIDWILTGKEKRRLTRSGRPASVLYAVVADG